MSTQVLTSTKIVRDSSTKEFIVQAYDQNGKRMPCADYFTTDIEDAEQSSEQMLNIAAMKKGPTKRMGYTLTLTKSERDAIDWIGNRYWHGDSFQNLLETCYPNENDDGDTWDENREITFAIPESTAWEIRDQIEDEDGDNLAGFSPHFIFKLWEFCSKIV